MGDYFFGLGPGWLTNKAATLAHRHGAELVNYTDQGCECGSGCAAHTCRMARRHWFVTARSPFGHDNEKVQQRVMTALEAAGVL